MKRFLLFILLLWCWNKDKTLHVDQRGFVLSDVMQIHFFLFFIYLVFAEMVCVSV